MTGIRTDETLVDRFRDVLERRADAPFYRLLGEGEDEPRVLSGTALDRRARAIAVALRERAAVGDRALILCPPGLDYVAAFFGCLYAGVVAVPAYPPDPGLLARMLPRLLGVIEDSTPAVVLAPASAMAMSEQIAALAPGIGELPWLAVDEVDEAAASEWRRPGLRSEDLAFLQYTSGSTGRPKGVMLSHANLLANLSAIDHHMLERGGNEPSSVIWLPPYHDMGLIGGLLLPAYRGYPVTFMSPLAFLKRPARWLRAVSDFRATHSGGTQLRLRPLCIEDLRAGARRSRPECLAGGLHRRRAGSCRDNGAVRAVFRA
nr:hypothetical protein GCM10020092_080100 [Actinoplanes digitatis]